jgi:ubiquinone/menaquinone biosynthesis C-methylase UbiE
MSLQTQNYYDGIAQGYKELYHEEQKEKIQLVKDYFIGSGLALDIGSGDGVLNEFLGERVELVSCDLSFELLKRNSNLRKIQCDISSLPFQDASFDSVMSFTVIQDCLEPEKVLEEVFRVLKKEGVFIVTFLKMSSKRELIETKIEEIFYLEEKRENEKDCLYVLKKR